MPITPGQAFWLAVPLPGQPSGGRHLCVVLSEQHFNDSTRSPVVAAIRRGAANAYKVAVAPTEYTPHQGQAPLDQDRVIGLDQLCSVGEAELNQAAGVVSQSVLGTVRRAMVRQFQLTSTHWRLRGEYWELTPQTAPYGQGVAIMNDAALSNPQQTQITLLPYASGPVLGPLAMVSRAALARRLGQLTPVEQGALSNLLKSIFGLP